MVRPQEDGLDGGGAKLYAEDGAALADVVLYLIEGLISHRWILRFYHSIYNGGMSL